MGATTGSTEVQLREQVVRLGRAMWERGLVSANDGNVSVRLPDGNVLCTPTGVSKGFMTPEMLPVVALDGTPLRGELRPSSEVLMHLRAYLEDPAVGAVVHAHPLHATAFAIKGEPLTGLMMPESVVAMPEVPLAPYATPSTSQVPDSIAPFVRSHTGCLLEHHGALTWGPDLMTAYLAMERLEYTARITVLARQIDGERQLSPERVAEVRRRFGIPA
ncbi:class II aldolase/adducin family protein [Actinotalea sp. M2MS4P-6]|uniref:class II aldolase/adducin family protein n=1 Tax=Actinotalea sp. M2MS4P-6 TaxID=2983762 RepID=UPI0021E4F1D3|nr:class II aldolase/adducin family protein [Actinotalea sp. M2MS4P-6]MCV2393052.1 class II aldolase/adducin family protein [Actinotalea sp. M2MS4P-6]